MSNVKRIPRTEPENSPEPLTSPESPPPDQLADYRKSLVDLQSLSEKRATLLGVQADLEGQLARAEVDREAALQKATESDELDADQGDELVRITTKAEVLKRKQTEVAKRLEAAQGELALLQSDVACRFSALWHAFYQWKLGEARILLESQLVPGVANHVIELVTRHHISVQPVRALDIRTTDAQDVLERAGKLLEAISVSGWSDVPAYTPATPLNPELDPNWTHGVPWGDRGVDVDAEIRALHREDSSLTLPRAMRLLYEKFPHIFTPLKEGTLSLNERLEWKAPMIGSTVLEPAEEQFSHAH